MVLVFKINTTNLRSYGTGLNTIQPVYSISSCHTSSIVTVGIGPSPLGLSWWWSLQRFPFAGLKYKEHIIIIYYLHAMSCIYIYTYHDILCISPYISIHPIFWQKNTHKIFDLQRFSHTMHPTNYIYIVLHKWTS